MDGMDVKGETPLVAEEARLARAAAAGDGGAFAALYERYEQRAFNLAYRIAGSEADAADAVKEAFLEVMRGLPRLADREPAFGSYLFAATRNACHELMHARQRTQPSETIPEPAAPRGEIREVPQEEVREASLRLPEHQREALALRELEQLSYEEIAAIVDTNPSAIAQLISRARINLHDELHGNILASVAAPSPECERALPLIAMREDGQLEAASRDAAWLDAHLAGCERCGLGIEVMREAGESYRSWAPIAAVPWLLGETMARAAELAGDDWSEAIAATAAARTPAESLPGMPSAYLASPDRDQPPRRRAALAAGLAALLLLAGLAVALARDDPPATSGDRAAGIAPGPSAAAPEAGAKPAKAGKANGDAAKKKKTRRTAGERSAGEPAGETIAGEALTAPASIPSQAAGGGGAPSQPASSPNRSPGKSAVQPTQRTSAPKPSPRPKPTATPAPAPQPSSAPAPAPTAEEPPPTEEPAEDRPGRSDPPGKPADRPPQK